MVTTTVVLNSWDSTCGENEEQINTLFGHSLNYFGIYIVDNGRLVLSQSIMVV